jgi:PAS domain S-box-containing protein
MNKAALQQLEQRLLVLAPNSQDAQYCRTILDAAGIAVTICRDPGAVCQEIGRGVGALLITDDALADERFDPVLEMLRGQPLWSDLALIVLAANGVDSRAADWSMETLANVVLLERTVHGPTLVAAVRSALRAHTRQLQVRDYIEEQRRIQRGLRDSERRFAAFMDHLPQAAWMKDLQGRYLYANAEAERIFSRPFAELAGKTDDELFPAETARHFRENDRRALAEGSNQTTVALRQPDGLEHHSLVNKFAVPGSDNGPAFVGGVAFDITERKHAEDALRINERRMRRFYESGIFGAIYWNMGGAITGANDKFLEMVGYSRADLEAGRVHWTEMTPPEYAPLDERSVTELKATGVGTPFEKEYIRKDGTRIPVIVAGAMLDEERHEGVAFVLDVTERERAERALREGEQRISGIIDSAMDAIITVDEKQRIILFNPAAETMFRCRETEALGQPLERFIPQRYREVHREHIHNFARTCSTTRAMGHLRALAALRADGEEFPIEASISQVQVGEQRLFTVILRDITERKRQDHALEAALARAEQASTAKDHFLAVLSHELRNPLTPVTTAVAILRMKLGQEPELQLLLEMISRNVLLEARLIDDLLDMTRIARSKVELDRQPVAVCEILQRTIEVCMPDIEARGLHFGINIDQPPHLINADAARMQQVFWNLLKNSVKFTPRGGCVGVRCWRQESQVVVEVADSGEGIEPEAMGRIFNPFEQAERAVTRRFGGLGLGLSISKALVEMHGGSIEARSPGKGQGATISVRLPLFADKQPSEPVADERTVAKPLRILLVEDYGDTANALRAFLVIEGHSVELAGDVATAIQLAEQHRFDLLISDLDVPDAAGLELIRELRARGYTGPGIAMGGFGLGHDIARSREAGFDALITKPASPERLSRVIAALTQADRSVSEGAAGHSASEIDISSLTPPGSGVT